ncbi:hypothetical protein Ancab_023329 [Ancistrocladus abbreviatus]
MEVIDRAHQMYREGSYEEALGFYTDALAMAKTKVQRIALHSNRAACYLKLHHFNKVRFSLCHHHHPSSKFWLISIVKPSHIRNTTRGLKSDQVFA